MRLMRMISAMVILGVLMLGVLPAMADSSEKSGDENVTSALLTIENKMPNALRLMTEKEQCIDTSKSEIPHSIPNGKTMLKVTPKTSGSGCAIRASILSLRVFDDDIKVVIGLNKGAGMKWMVSCSKPADIGPEFYKVECSGTHVTIEPVRR